VDGWVWALEEEDGGLGLRTRQPPPTPPPYLPRFAVLRDVESLHGQVILFIDELHLLVGAGGGEGAMDASNMLKPALARGELRCMGATTLDEYRWVAAGGFLGVRFGRLSLRVMVAQTFPGYWTSPAGPATASCLGNGFWKFKNPPVHDGTRRQEAH
jgi:hypothetical protein